MACICWKAISPTVNSASACLKQKQFQKSTHPSWKPPSKWNPPPAQNFISIVRAGNLRRPLPLPASRSRTLPGWTRQRTQLLNGGAEGSHPIAAITINGKPEFIELAAPHRQFQLELPLQEGRNPIHILAEDITGHQTATNLVLMADWTPPQIHLHRTGTALSITFRDNLELHQLEINNRTLSPSGKEYTTDCPRLSGEPLRLTASDCAGNRVEWTLTEKELQHLAQTTQAAPPRLHLTDAGKTLTLYNPEYALDLRAEDDTSLRTVELNGKNLLTRTTPLFRTLCRIPLSEGTNRLALVAEDFDGNHNEEQITVIYRRPEYLDRIYRLATTLSPLAGEIPDPVFAQRVNLLIGHELIHDPIRFYLLAAENETRFLSKEKALSSTDLADPRATLKEGKKLNADLSFITRVLDDAPGYTIYTQVLDTHSGDELFIEDIYLEDRGLLPQQINGLVMKIEQHFPLIQASVRQKDNHFLINAGAEQGAESGMRFIVIRSEGDFEQGRVVRTGNQPAELVISKVESTSARVIMPKGQIKNSVRAGDFVFSR